MRIRMCPYCDHEMTKRHHCDTCNSFVWKADMVDIHFNHDQRRGDVDCAYPENAADWQKHRGSNYDAAKAASKHSKQSRVTVVRTAQPQPNQGRAAQTNARRGANSGRTARQTSNSAAYPQMNAAGQTSYQGGRPPGSKPQARKKSNVFVVILIIWILIIAIGVIGNLLSKFSRDDIPAEDSDGYRELTHEEVMEMGQECNAFGHFDLDGLELYREMLAAFGEDFGIAYPENDSESREPDLQVREENTIMEGEYGYTSFEMTYDFPFEDGRYLMVSCDSFSGRLHEVRFSMENTGDSKALLDFIMRYFKENGIDTSGWDEDQLDQVYVFEDGETQYRGYGEVDIYTSQGDDYFYTSIGASY